LSFAWSCTVCVAVVDPRISQSCSRGLRAASAPVTAVPAVSGTPLDTSLFA
jgi:hypothetical protein